MCYLPRSNTFFTVCILVLLMFNTAVSGGPTAAIPTETSTPSLVTTPTLPAEQLEPQAWLDEAIDPEQFSPNGSLIVHFNLPIDERSSLSPLLSWPSVDGSNRWDASRTTLTFSPGKPLDNSAAYTFFLDPALRSSDGRTLENLPEWQVLTRDVPKIVRISPPAGDLDRRYGEITITFDQAMRTSLDREIISIDPPVPFELTWKTLRILRIKLETPFAFGQHYELTVHKSLTTVEGSYLDRDHTWSYQQLPVQAQIESLTDQEVKIAFSYWLDRRKTGLEFSVSPALDGTWTWVSERHLAFKSSIPIPADKLYTIKYPALVDLNGFDVPAQPVQFSGIPPIVLLADTGYQPNKYNISKHEYSWGIHYYANEDLNEIRLEFLVPVDHASAEQALSLKPSVRGAIRWEKNSQNHDILIYEIKQPLQQGKEYTIRLDPAMQDPQGQPVIAQLFSAVVRINEEYGTYPSFGALGHNIQVLDTYGPRRLQYAAGKEQAVFAAYRLDLVDFVKLYPRDRSRSSAGIQDIPIPAQATPAAVWSNSSEREIEKGYSIIETTLPSELEPGLYVVNASDGEVLRDQMFVVLSRNTLAVKDNGHKLTAWLTDINGRVVENAEIRVYNLEGEKVREGQSDENGLYTVSMPGGDVPMLVFARVRARGQPDDVTVVGLNFTEPTNDRGQWYSRFSSWRSGSRWLDWEDPARDFPQGRPLLAYIYTERPIYKPGQTVYFKAILRMDDDMRYSLPETGTPVTIRVRDARGNTLYTFPLAINDFGSVNGNFVIPEAAMLGRYTIEAEINGITNSALFRVEDYRKPDYQVSITSLQPEKQNRYVRGEDVKIQVHVAYYFGEPVVGARLSVATIFDRTYSTSLPGVSGNRITDAQGNATLTIKAPDYDGGYDFWRVGAQRARLQITADDGSRQPVTGHYYIDVYPTLDQISLDTGGYYAQPGKPVTVNITDVDIFDQPVARRELSLLVQSWNKTTFDFKEVIQRLPIKTDAAGIASLQLMLKAGYYRLTLTGQDNLGNRIEISRWVYVFEDKTDWFVRQPGEYLIVSSDKERYRPYERARLAIESTFSGPAWLTFERGSVISSKQIELTAPLTILETEIIPEHAPNVFVTVNAWQKASSGVYRDGYPDSYESGADSYLRVARVHVHVDANSKALEIEITPDKQTYRPGETIQANIRVKDAAGQPVSAELSLAAVDESIFALAKENVQPIFDAFYSPRGLAVDTYDTMAAWRYVYQPDFGGGGDEMPPDLRVDFLDTTAWLPVIETDRNGKATAQFKLPDNTTRWRIAVKAVTRQHQVGEAQAYIETKKELFVRPILPRVLTQGDVATLTTFIHNYSRASQEVQVHLDAPGLELRDPADQRISLPAGESRVVGWQVTVITAKPTQVTIRARAGQLQDGVQLPLSIRPALTREVQTESGQFTSATTLALNLPEVDRKNSRVTLTLNRSLSGTLLNGLEFLTGYPYGCVEQTMSRALPNAVVAHAAAELGLEHAEFQTELSALVEASLVKIYGLQHGDGGWGWWYDDNSDAYQTAWVLFGLTVINDSGYPVEPRVIEEAANWLNENRIGDPRIQAYAFYSLARAGQGDLEKTLLLAQTGGDDLDPFSQAALALALHDLGEEAQAGRMLKLLEQSMQKEGDVVYWQQFSEDGGYHHKTMSSSLRTTALALQAFVEIDSQNALIPGMVQYLVSKRQGLRGWGTTNETSYTILALTEYLAMQEKSQSTTPYQVFLNGELLATGILEAGQVRVNLELPLAKMSAGANILQLQAEGGAPLYFDLTMEYARLNSSPQAFGSLEVARRYLSPDGKTVVADMEANQLVQVELTVEIPEDISYFALEDYLPGGLEALNEGLNASLEPASSWDDRAFRWNDYGYNYKEIRADRVVFFVTSLSKGRHTFTYMARATTPGQFAALPAQAYAMYNLDLWGRSDGTAIAVEK